MAIEGLIPHLSIQTLELLHEAMHQKMKLLISENSYVVIGKLLETMFSPLK